MAHGYALMPGFPKGSGKEILTRATFGMGILYIAYAIVWPVLPGGLFLYRAFPWVALAALGLAAMGWFVQQRRKADSVSGGNSGTRRRSSPSSLPPSMRLIKEILTDTILCMGGLFILFAIIAPFVPDLVAGPGWWAPLVFLGLIAMYRLLTRRS